VRLLDQSWVAGIRRIAASTERMAIQIAAAVGAHLELPVQHYARPGENDRSATGDLSAAEFEALADAFFAQPCESVRG